jgi:hypothetical protein
MQKSHYLDAPAYCHPFFDLVTASTITDALKSSGSQTLELIASIPETKASYQYLPEKWTVKQILSHIIDCERVYAYRALRLSRKDATPLAGFDENTYVMNAAVEARSLEQLSNEYNAVRNASILLYDFMTNEMLDFKGIANNVFFTARSLGYMIAGHNIHHCNILRERYL